MMAMAQAIGIGKSVDVAEEASRPSEAPKPAPAEVSPTILALCSDAAARDHLTELAIEKGYGLCCRSEWIEVVRVLAADAPGVFVIDMDAPGARDFLRTVRAHATWRKIPLLALTASNNPMVTVSIDAPTFFLPEMNGLEHALAMRLEPPPESS
jgi:CheY-like chemotaxis protein